MGGVVRAAFPPRSFGSPRDFGEDRDGDWMAPWKEGTDRRD